MQARVVSFTTRDGVRLDGALVGEGPMGIVFIHEYPADLCGWWQFAVHAARRGMHAMLFDMRCLGRSGCGAKGRDGAVSDVRAAIERLRRDGARRIAIVGASWGGTIAVVAGAALHPDAVVELSGEVRGFVPGYGDAKMLDAAPELRAPALFASARGDRYVSPAETRATYRAAGSATKRVRVLPLEAGHGWGMLFGISRPWSPLAAETLSFLRQELRGR
jgi:dienelactone hydrolase